MTSCGTHLANVAYQVTPAYTKGDGFVIGMYCTINLGSTGYQCLMAAELARYTSLTGVAITAVADERQISLLRQSYPAVTWCTEAELPALDGEQLLSGWQVSELLAQADGTLPWFLTGFMTGNHWMNVGLPLSVASLPRLRWSEAVATQSRLAVQAMVSHYAPVIESGSFDRIHLIGILYDKKSAAPETGVTEADRTAWSAARSLPLALLAETLGALQLQGRETRVLYLPLSLQYSRSAEDEIATRQLEEQVSQLFLDSQIPIYRSPFTTWWDNFEVQAAFLSALADPDATPLPSQFCYLGAGATPCHLIQLLPQEVKPRLYLLFPDQDAPTGAIDGNGYWKQFAYHHPLEASAYVGEWASIADRAVHDISEC